MATGSSVRKATLADAPRLAQALASAFQDDPVIAWIFLTSNAAAASRQPSKVRPLPRHACRGAQGSTPSPGGCQAIAGPTMRRERC